MLIIVVMVMLMVMVMMMMSRMMGAANDCADDCIKTAISLCLWCLYYTIYIHFILLIIIIIIIIHLSLLIIVFTGSHNRIYHFGSREFFLQNYFLRGDFILQKDRLKSLITVRNQSFNILLNLIWGLHCLRYITTNTEKNTAGKTACGQLALAYLVVMMTQQTGQ